MALFTQIYHSFMEELGKVEGEMLDWLSTKTNRSLNQTLFLYNLLNKDYDKLVQLELNIANSFYGACPGDIEEVNKILLLKPKRRNVLWMN